MLSRRTSSSFVNNDQNCALSHNASTMTFEIPSVPRQKRLRAGARPLPANATSLRADAMKRRETEDRNAGRRPSFHTREFPQSLVDYRSERGHTMLVRSLSSRTAEQYLPLTASFQMQSEPAYCALTTLAVALNALHVDPGKVWKGGWRWFTEENLDFCSRRGACQTLGLEEGAGLNFFDLRCIAKRNGAALQIHLACDDEINNKNNAEGSLRCEIGSAHHSSREGHNSSNNASHGGRGGSGLEAFREAVVRQCSTASSSSVMIASFDRQVLGQTGGGHFSPVAAYDEDTDSALVLDVARFKYPPFWVALPLLWKAMATSTEPSSGRPRGYALVQRHADHSLLAPPSPLLAASTSPESPPCCIDDGTHKPYPPPILREHAHPPA